MPKPSAAQTASPAPVGGSGAQQTQPTSAEQAELDRLEAEIAALGADEPVGPLVVAAGRTVHYAGPQTDGKVVKFQAGEEVPFSHAEIAAGEPEKLERSGHLTRSKGAAIPRSFGVNEAEGKNREGARVSVKAPNGPG